MVDFAIARKAMVDSQVSTSSVMDARLLTAMGRVPREAFLPETRRAIAYIDDHHQLGGGRFMPAPAIFARLVELLEIEPGETALDVGAGTGYGTAVLAALATSVTGLEAIPELAARADQTLKALGVANAQIFAGNADDLGDARFDAIVVEGTLTETPTELLERLSVGGRLAAVVRQGGTATAMLYRRETEGVTASSHFHATLPPLVAEKAPDEFVF